MDCGHDVFSTHDVGCYWKHRQTSEDIETHRRGGISRSMLRLCSDKGGARDCKSPEVLLRRADVQIAVLESKGSPAETVSQHKWVDEEVLRSRGGGIIPMVRPNMPTPVQRAGHEGDGNGAFAGHAGGQGKTVGTAKPKTKPTSEPWWSITKAGSGVPRSRLATGRCSARQEVHDDEGQVCKANGPAGSMVRAGMLPAVACQKPQSMVSARSRCRTCHVKTIGADRALPLSAHRAEARGIS